MALALPIRLTCAKDLIMAKTFSKSMKKLGKACGKILDVVETNATSLNRLSEAGLAKATAIRNDVVRQEIGDDAEIDDIIAYIDSIK